MISSKHMFRTGLACGLLLLGNAAVPATGATIKVTTFLDENGSNASACSLREALYVVSSKNKAAWGGCPAGASVGDNVIQLEAGTYSLTAGELMALSAVIIQGADTTVKDDEATPAVDESLNPYTGKAPYRKPPVTIIDAGGNSRVISTLGATGSGLSLKDLELRNGKPSPANGQGNGGAIYAGVSLSLSNVVIRGSEAQPDTSVTPAVGGMGGAIFLSRNEVSLSTEDTSLIGNTAATTGGAIAMVCNQDLSLATHTLTMTRTLLANNSSTGGAGAIEACGLASVTLTASTLSKNTSNAASAALSYIQTVNGQGSLTVTNVTAAEQLGGAVFALKGLSTVDLDNSLLIGNVPGKNCVLDPALSSTIGNYNAIDDASCDRLLVTSSSANQHPSQGQMNSELLPLALKGGLTQVYLLTANSSIARDNGPDGEECTGTDQRGFSRKNGAKCDIGAVERMQPTAVDDQGENDSKSRVIILDVLNNDSFGEGDNGPYRFADAVTDGMDAVEVVGDGGLAGSPAHAVCRWYDKDETNEAYRNRLVIDNGGAITADDQPVSCTYKVNVITPTGTASSSAADPATVTASVSNIAPVAAADSYIRPLGVTTVNLNLLANDTDADDSSPFDSPLHAYPIYIATQPVLGDLVIDGEPGLCPGSSYTSGSVKFCYPRTIKYVARNAQSPFTDTFQYAVYDDDGSISPAATVTIKTNAPDPDKGETGGSLDLAGGLLLALLGLRRARKL